MTAADRRRSPAWRAGALALACALVVAAGCGRSASGPAEAAPPIAARGPADAERSASSLAPAPAPESAPPPAGSSQAVARSATQAAIADLETRLGNGPPDASALLTLGTLLLQRARETADPSLYERAEASLVRARALARDDPLVLVGLGSLALARHEFRDALAAARAALAIEPGLPDAQGVAVDALVELGRYDEAVAAAQAMVDARPDRAAYARVSYLRELHGDLAGALEAMEAAVAVGGGTPHDTAYLTVLAGNLLTYLGRTAEAEAAYERALAAVPDFGPALAAQGRAAIGAGDLPTAAARFERAAAILPLPEYVVALGEVREASGDRTGARQAYDLARVETRLFESAGVVVDLELALFEADHGDRRRAVALAEAAHAERPTVRAADALAWAQYRAGRVDDALALSREARRLGSREPLLLYHAGLIEAAAGHPAAARELLRDALAHDPGFSATGARAAAEALGGLGG